MNPDYARTISEIFENLKSQSSEVFKEYDLDGEPGEYRIAYSVVEIAESAEKLTKIAMKLREQEHRGDAEELLSDFKDELDHVLYHVKDSGLFSSLLTS